MSVQTVHFFRPAPPSPKVYRPTFLGSKTSVLCSSTFIVQQQKLTNLQSLQCDKWYIWVCIMIYRLQLIILLYTSKFNLNILYFLWIQRKYIKFHNMKFKMPKSQLLIRLETSFKNWHNVQNVNIYFSSKAYICCYPLPPSVRCVHLWKCWQLRMAPLMYMEHVFFK